MRLIAFNGVMGSGKSTAIEMLRENYPTSEIVLVKFAQVLYDIQEYIYGQVTPVYTRPASFVKDRKLLQWLGTEWGRGINENLWVNLWVMKVREAAARNPNAIIVCDDCRFDNEAEVIKTMGGTVIKIECQAATDRITTANGIKNHASESGISGHLVDIIIENNGTLQDYKDSLDVLYREVGMPQR